MAKTRKDGITGKQGALTNDTTPEMAVFSGTDEASAINIGAEGETYTRKGYTGGLSDQKLAAFERERGIRRHKTKEGDRYLTAAEEAFRTVSEAAYDSFKRGERDSMLEGALLEAIEKLESEEGVRTYRSTGVTTRQQYAEKERRREAYVATVEAENKEHTREVEGRRIPVFSESIRNKNSKDFERQAVEALEASGGRLWRSLFTKHTNAREEGVPTMEEITPVVSLSALRNADDSVNSKNLNAVLKQLTEIPRVVQKKERVRVSGEEEPARYEDHLRRHMSTSAELLLEAMTENAKQQGRGV